MSSPLGPLPGGDGFGGPASNPDTTGIPPGAGGEGVTPGGVQGGDSRDPGFGNDGDIGPDLADS